MLKRLFGTALAAAVTLSLITPAAHAGQRVRLVGEQIVPHGLVFDGTTVGGLSSIDRDPRTGEYVLISDDRVNARFYTAKLDPAGSFEITGVHPFKRPDGTIYPPQGVDPEELRVDPWLGTYYWSQEGDRTPTVLLDPSVREARRDGSHLRELPLPEDVKMRPESGPRQNYGPEGMTFAAHGALVVTAFEGPLLQDGPEATTERGAVSRILVQGRYGPVFAQYRYQQEPIFAASNPPGAFANNGVTSILAAEHNRFLVMERSFVTGVGNKVRIFEIDLAKPGKKKLVTDLSALGLSTVDNVEGMAWGPRLPSGERSLVLVSDNNFSATQVTQVITLALR
ncbi:esterase-like activity of phytase family protein [Amycolatopsis albispora]|uniref:3-phytase n=1 Tax=Amycolatopsis albispora TaxID=1804986 RepID=A0A344LLK0_9PSEU|nr:esterase-like activity of phytase family protein [Amycolatopsis albispora]AXB48924.1 3-phytase [Amycolatopsis albispora]